MIDITSGAPPANEERTWPVLFVGHGSPLNALHDNTFTAAWSNLGRQLGRPRAILVISGHWCTHGTMVTAMEDPDTLYDFGYQNLFHLRYPAPGSPRLAMQIVDLLKPHFVAPTQTWGLDHGAWVPLQRMYPEADIPVVQLSVDTDCGLAQHRDFGRMLSPLRKQGVLIVASGNIVHNLELTIRQGVARPYHWAEQYDAAVRDKLIKRDWDALVDYRLLSHFSSLAVPTPDHYLPLLYALGAAELDESIVFPVEGIDRGSMSMRTIAWGDLKHHASASISPGVL
jgi:4,5-DOPA dioxygenase extradiol